MLLTRYELKLRCHKDNKIYQGGLFRGDFTLASIRFEHDAELLDCAIMKLIRKSNCDLHAPSQQEFLNENKPSEDALFYFTENGQEEFEKVFSNLSNEINNHQTLYDVDDEETILFSEMELVKIEIDLSKVKKYTCCYQDNYQMCIEF